MTSKECQKNYFDVSIRFREYDDLTHFVEFAEILINSVGIGTKFTLFIIEHLLETYIVNDGNIKMFLICRAFRGYQSC